MNGTLTRRSSCSGSGANSIRRRKRRTRWVQFWVDTELTKVELLQMVRLALSPLAKHSKVYWLETMVDES